MEVRIGEALQVEPSTDSKRRLKMWGVNGFRYETANWERDLRALNRKARENRQLVAAGNMAGVQVKHERPRVFINSLSDIFEDWSGPVYRLEDGKPVVVAQSLDDVRTRFFRVAEECTELDLLLLTKRPENALRMVPLHWLKMDGKWPAWVWIGTTVEDQEHADKRIPELLKVPARVRFLSVEPLLGPIDLRAIRDGSWHDQEGADFYDSLRGSAYHSDGRHALGNGPRVSWVIVGGESGTNARPMHPDWVRKVRDQCVAAGVPFFFKQWGEWLPFYDRDVDDPDWRNVPKTDGRKTIRVNLAGGQGFHGERVVCSRKVGKKNAGRVLDGRTSDEVPR
jgi:protein gp37